MVPRLAFALLLVGCGRPGLDDNFGVEEDRGPAACENLDTLHCTLPFPSDRYLGRDAQGGPMLALEPDGLPINVRGEPFDVSALAGLDGFGIASPALFLLRGAAHTGTEGVFDPEPSLGADARTVMINAETGERIPHWLEADYLVPYPPYLFTLRPAVPLPRGARIVVGVRGMVDEDGAVVDAAPGFAALRDQEASRYRGLHARRDHFEEHIFPVLEQAGIPRDELQLAWDFTTASRDVATRDLLTMRDRMLEQVGSEGPAYTWTSITAPDDPNLAVIADGVALVPSFLLPEDELGVRVLRRDAEGLPVAEGFEEVPFRLQVPKSAFDTDTPSPVMQYGHGFLGRLAEGNNRWLRELADEYRFSYVAANMQGMDENVIGTWLGALGDNGGNLPLLVDEVLQGVTNHLALQRMVRGGLVTDDHALLVRADGGGLFDGAPLYYYGNSQGGSVGTVIMGTSVDVERGVLGVPGCCYPFLINRSYVFNSYALILGAMYPDHADLSVIVGLVGTGWDRFEPLTFAQHITDDPLPGTPSHQVLLHVAREDGQVLNEVSHVLARAVGAPSLAPAVRPIWGLEEVETPYVGPAATTEYDFGIEPHDNPLEPRPEEPDSHGWLRAQPEGRLQMMHFLQTGEFIHTCDGLCVFDGKP